MIKNYYSDDIILYTYFWCYLFTKNHDENLAKKLYNEINQIETFDNGYIKYSNNYMRNYSVPNIMPMFLYVEILNHKK